MTQIQVQVQCDACDIWVHYKCERLDIKSIEEIENNFNSEYICCSCQALRSLQNDSITETTRGEEPSKCIAVEKQSIKIVANKIGNKQKCALSKTTNELIDTNDHVMNKMLIMKKHIVRNMGNRI